MCSNANNIFAGLCTSSFHLHEAHVRADSLKHSGRGWLVLPWKWLLRIISRADPAVNQNHSEDTTVFCGKLKKDGLLGQGGGAEYPE